jgi:hypothetical protein
MKKICIILLLFFTSACVTLLPIYKQEFRTLNSLPEIKIAIETKAKGKLWELDIKNNSKETIKFLINDSSYVATTGVANRLIRGQTRRIHSDQAQPAIPIPPNARFHDFLTLEGFVNMSDFDFSYYPLVVGDPNSKGKFYLVFEINGKKKNYIIEVNFIKEKEEYFPESANSYFQ